MHMKVVKTLLLGEKQYVRFRDLQFVLENSGEGRNEPPKYDSLIRG